MKGVVFTEFMEYVEAQYSPEMADDIIEASNPASGGAYTSVGTYSHKELVGLIAALSDITGQSMPSLIESFGSHLFGRLIGAFPEFLNNMENSFDFLKSVDSKIHVEVQKLYPDAELPSFEYASKGPNELSISYSSNRPFSDLAEGMIKGCIAHFGESIAVVREAQTPEHSNSIRFHLTRAA